MRPSHVLALLSLAACAGSSASRPDPSTTAGANPAAISSSVAASAKSTPTDDPPPSSLPTACADGSAAVCTPPNDFVERLCGKPHQDLALSLFGKSTPFTRMYLRGKMDELTSDEEVIALRYHGVPKNGIQVGSASGTYDVLRWDGSCAMAVDADMISRNRPSRAKTARVQWHRIGNATQDALIAGNDALKRAHAKRGKECRGAMTGDVSAACEKADAGLVDAIVEYVRGGGTLPVPDAP